MNQLFCSWAAGPGGRGTARPPGSGSPGRTPASRWRGRSGGRGGQRTCPVRTAGHCYTPALVWALLSRAPPRRRQPRPRRERAQRSRPARTCWLLPCRSRRGRVGGGETARAVEGGVAAGQPGWVAGGPSHARVDGGEAPVQLAGDCGGAARPAARTRQAQLSKNIQIWLWWLFLKWCRSILCKTNFSAYVQCTCTVHIFWLLALMLRQPARCIVVYTLTLSVALQSSEELISIYYSPWNLSDKILPLSL